MEACHILLGRPWEFDRDAIKYCQSNRYAVKSPEGEKFTLLPLPPHEILKSQMKMHKEKQEQKNGLTKEMPSEGKKEREFGKSKSGEDEKQTERRVVRDEKVENERITLKSKREKPELSEKKGSFMIQPTMRGAPPNIPKLLLMFSDSIANPPNPLENLPSVVKSVLQEYEDVFRDDLPPGLPPIRGIEHQIDFIPGAVIPNRPAYKANPTETKEL